MVDSGGDEKGLCDYYQTDLTPRFYGRTDRLRPARPLPLPLGADMHRNTLLGLLLILAIGITACSDSTEPEVNNGGEEENHPNDENAIIKDNVVVVERSPLNLASVNGDVYTYNYSGDAPEIEVGDVLVSQGSDGKEAGKALYEDSYLRKVTEVAGAGSQIILTTTQGSLVDIFEECTVDESIDLSFDPVPGLGNFLPGVEFTDNGLLLDDVTLLDIDLGYGQFRVKFFAALQDGRIIFVDPTLNLNFTIADSDVTEFRSTVTTKIEMRADLEAEASLAYTDNLPPIELYRDVKYYRHMVWIVPVVHKVTTTVTLETEFEVGAGVHAFIDDFGADIEIDVGAQWSEGTWEHIDNSTLVTSLPEPEITYEAHARVKPYLVIKVEDKLYGVAGPNVRAEPYIQALAWTDFNEWCLTVDAGCDVGCGAALDLGIIDMDLDIGWDSPPLNVFEWELYHDCWNLKSGLQNPARVDGLIIGRETGYRPLLQPTPLPAGQGN